MQNTTGFIDLRAQLYTVSLGIRSGGIDIDIVGLVVMSYNKRFVQQGSTKPPAASVQPFLSGAGVGIAFLGPNGVQGRQV